MANIESYFLRDCPVEIAAPLHNCLVTWRDTLLTDKDLQYALTHAEFDSYMDIRNATFNRTRAIGHLMVVQEMIQRATTPMLLNISAPLDGDIALTMGGYDAASLEAFQREWFESEITPVIRDYEQELTHAFDEYNLQFVLHNARYRYTALPSQAFDLEKALRTAFPALDSAYYSRGNTHMSIAGNHYQKLEGSEFGKKFILSPEELQQFLRI